MKHKDSRYNDATRELIESLRATKVAKEAAKKAAQEAAAAEKQKQHDERIQRMEAFRIQRDRENRQRIIDRRSTSSGASADIPTVQRKHRSLDPSKLAQVGERIPGSALFRDFCISCGEAMRVVDAGRPNTCLDCKPTGCPGSTNSTLTKNNIEYHGGTFHSAEW